MTIRSGINYGALNFSFTVGKCFSSCKKVYFSRNNVGILDKYYGNFNEILIK